MTTRLLGIGEIRTIVGDVGLAALYDGLIARLHAAFARHDPESTITIDRSGFHYEKPSLGLLEWMPAMELGRLASIKTVGYHPTNPTERGTPSVLGTTSLYDTTDGRLLALTEATFLTALRTGAASAVASDVLARPGSETLGMIGCGAQAVTQIHAISRVRPIRRILAHDADPTTAATLATRLRGLGSDEMWSVETVDGNDIGRLLDECDIICTATSIDIGAPPVLVDGPHRPWLHVNAVGADFPGKREIDPALLRRALVCPDVLAQCLLEGECQQLEASSLGPDLAGLVADRARWEAERARLTVFDSTGWALEDLIVAELMLEHAERLGIGTEIELQPHPSDPYDPYDFLRRR